MIEPSEGNRRVVFELPSEHVPGLMEVLGDFVAKHNIGIEFADSQADSLSLAVDAERPAYNPELVEWLPETEDSPPLAFMPLNKLRKFAEQQGRPTIASRVFRSAWRGMGNENNEERYFCYDRRTGIEGFKAENFVELVDILARKDIPNFGVASVGFLQAVKDQLIITEGTEQPKE